MRLCITQCTLEVTVTNVRECVKHRDIFKLMCLTFPFHCCLRWGEYQRIREREDAIGAFQYIAWDSAVKEVMYVCVVTISCRKLIEHVFPIEDQ